MTLHLYDSATRTLREFIPLRPRAASIYVCGATVQGVPHIGHVRSALNYDVLRRWLMSSGHDVMYDCKRGECGLCVMTVVEATGEIDHRDVFLSEHQRAAGDKICVCVSRVTGGAITLESGWRADDTPAFSKVFAPA